MFSGCKRYWRALKATIFKKRYFDLSFLPVELLTIILDYLPYDQQIRDRRVCRGWNYALRQQRTLIIRHSTILNLANPPRRKRDDMIDMGKSRLFKTAGKINRFLAASQNGPSAIVFDGELDFRLDSGRGQMMNRLRQNMAWDFSYFCLSFVTHIEYDIDEGIESVFSRPIGPILAFVNMQIAEVIKFQYICGKLRRPILLRHVMLGSGFDLTGTEARLILHGDHILRRVVDTELWLNQCANGDRGQEMMFVYEKDTEKRITCYRYNQSPATTVVSVETREPIKEVDFYGVHFTRR